MTLPPQTVVPGAEPFAADGGRVGVLVSHGFTGSPASVRPWAQALADAGYSVRLPLLPGHGTRWEDANKTTWHDWYAAVEASFDELRGRCDTVFAMGLSLGGTLALRLAEERGSQVAGVAVVNPHFVNTRWDAKYLLPVLGRLVASWPAIGNDIKKEGMDEVAYDKTPVKAAVSAVELGKTVKADLGKVTQPLLVLGSRDDHLVDPVNVELLLAG
ncbi:MAG: carboxylesterase, partial [Frankiaceae bacterium]|nr:carboxylesterase [Frankiaceae bacterium]